MSKYEEALQGLGLNQKESLVYSSLLQLGKATAYRIAQKSGLKKPTVYVILDELRQKGLVLKIPYPNKQIYSAKHPEVLIRDAEEKLRRVHNALPELLALTQSEDKPSVMYFEGLGGVEKVLNYGLDKLEGGELIGFNAHGEKISEELLEIFLEYNKRLKKSGIKVRGFVPDHPSLEKFRESDAEFGRNMRVIPFQQYSSDVSVDIGPDFVKLLMFNDLQGVVIEHKGVACAFKQIFEMMWTKQS